MMYFARRRATASTAARRSPPRTIPKQYNGIKMVRREAFPLSGDAGIGDIRDMMRGGRIPAAVRPPGQRRARRRCSTTTSRRSCRSSTRRSSSRSTSCSTPAAAWPDWSRRGSSTRLPCRTTRLCFEIDGTFPNHEANPLIEENRPRHHRARHRGEAPTSASRGTATPTAASSSTAAASSSPATSSRRCWPRPRSSSRPGAEDRLRRPRQLRRQGHRRADTAARR